MTKDHTVSRTIIEEGKEDKVLGPMGERELGLNAKRLLFCQLYASDREFFGNGVESYSEAYGLDLSNPAKYRACVSGASRLLTNANVLSKINSLLETGVLNDTWVDKQLSFVITQNADFPSKVAAIREYNKLKGRIIERSIRQNIPVPKPLLGGDARKAMDRKQPDLILEAETEEIVSEEIITIKKKVVNDERLPN